MASCGYLHSSIFFRCKTRLLTSRQQSNLFTFRKTFTISQQTPSSYYPSQPESGSHMLFSHKHSFSDYSGIQGSTESLVWPADTALPIHLNDSSGNERIIEHHAPFTPPQILPNSFTPQQILAKSLLGLPDNKEITLQKKTRLVI